MKKSTIISLVIVVILIAMFMPIKSVQTGGSCLTASLTLRHDLILGDTLPQSEGISSDVIGEGCAPLVKHELYLL